MTKSDQRPKKTPVDYMPLEFLAGIGDVMVRWGSLQHQLAGLVSLACRVESRTAPLFNYRSTMVRVCDQLTSIADSEYWVKDSSVRAKIGKLARDVRNAKDVRNDLAHAVIYYGVDPRVFVRLICSQKGEGISEQRLTVEMLRKSSEDARELA